MAEKSVALLATILVIVGLLVGGIFTYALIPREVTVTKEVTKTVPVEVIKEVTKEVIKEVNVTKEVPAKGVLDKAIATFMEAVDDEKDEAGNPVDLQFSYDFADISVDKVSKDYKIVVSDNGDKTIVNFEIRLKYNDKTDDERSAKATYNVRVTYEDDEDTEVKIIP